MLIREGQLSKFILDRSKRSEETEDLKFETDAFSIVYYFDSTIVKK